MSPPKRSTISRPLASASASSEFVDSATLAARVAYHAEEHHEADAERGTDPPEPLLPAEQRRQGGGHHHAPRAKATAQAAHRRCPGGSTRKCLWTKRSQRASRALSTPSSMSMPLKIMTNEVTPRSTTTVAHAGR